MQSSLRASLAHIRQARVAPSAIVAPLPGAVPPALGVGLPSAVAPADTSVAAGLQEERVARDSWVGVRDALERLKAARTPMPKEDTEMRDVRDGTNALA